MQVRLSHENGELEPLYVMRASSLLRSVRGWRGEREHRKAVSCLQRGAGRAVQWSRSYALDSAPGRFKTCLPIRFHDSASESSYRSAWLWRLSPWAAKGDAMRTWGLGMFSLPVL